MKFLPLICGLLTTHTLVPLSFLYPVAVLQSKPILYLIYQKSPKDIELWQWNYQTKETKKILGLPFHPAGIRILPDESGFSFVDNDIIKLQRFDEPLPQVVNIDQPLHDMSVICWIDKHCCYLSAKKGNYYNIFQLNTQGNVETIVKSSQESLPYRYVVLAGYDCMYPQKINNTLFYIERHRKVQYYYRVVSVAYSSNPGECRENEKNRNEIFDFVEQPIAFLYMASEQEGYLVVYPHEVDKESKTICFDYYQIYKKNDAWYDTKLFSFKIPTEFLFFDTDLRLYESMLPLLPRHVDTDIYYTSCTADNAHLNIFQYDLVSGATKQMSFARKNNKHYFSPLYYEHRNFYGFSFCENPLSLFCECLKIPYLEKKKDF